MSEPERLSPDELLKAAKREEKDLSKGKLKIFLGMSAGVGKTYAMLEAAQGLRKQGKDVVIGSIYTHGRVETAALLEGLKIIPEKKIDYRGILFNELDLDEILKQKPEVVLVDELAHSNVPGSRHPKRWQDVVEILENGIDVFTTLNVQHIESLKDVVENIAGIDIRETVPDSIIEEAANIELIDLTPTDLLVRLHEGKVYLADKSKAAAEHFFQEDRLTALREIVLRYTAEKVDHELQDMASTTERVEGWKPRERLLVAINQSESSQRLIRTTCRIASKLNCPWVAVYVNDGRQLTDAENDILNKNFALARDLRGDVVTVNDSDIAEAIRRIARQRGITQIILGRSPKKPVLRLFQKDDLFEILSKSVQDIDLHVIGTAPTLKRKYKQKLPSLTAKTQVLQYVFAAIFVGFLIGIDYLLFPLLDRIFFGMLSIVGVLVFSFFFMRGPLYLGVLLYTFLWERLFIEGPGRYFNQELTAFAFFIFIVIPITYLIDRARENKELLVKREETTNTLYYIIRQIANAKTPEEAFENTKRRLERLFNGVFEFIPKKAQDGLNLNIKSTLLTDEKEKNAAIWVFENEQEAGWSTETLPSSKNFYIPLKGYNETCGVLIYRPATNAAVTPEEKNFFYTVGKQFASFLERFYAQESAKHEEAEKQIGKIRATILSKISLLFQQPLLILRGSVKKMHDLPGNEVKIIENTLDQLNEILANITALGQLTEGIVPLSKRKYNVIDLISECQFNLREALAEHPFKSTVEENLPLVPFDFNLIELLVINLLSNSIYYSPPHTLIEVKAQKAGEYVEISIWDEGKWIPEGQTEEIFEQFYQPVDPTLRGVGLGLTLAKPIAEAHRGFLRAQNRSTGGVIFSIFLPLGD